MVLGVLLTGGLIFSLSQTLVVPALPRIGETFGASPADTSWLMTGFLLAASVATPIIGKLGDLFGMGRMLVYMLLVCAAGSLVCALAPSLEVLVAGRLLQGTSAGIFPLAYGIIRDTFPPSRVGGAIGLLGGVLGIGAGVGLPLSGVIVGHADLRVVFWVGFLALPAALTALLVLPRSPPAKNTTVDWAGAALFSAALGLILLAVTKAPAWGWGSPRIAGLLAAGLIACTAWAAVEARTETPLIDLRVLRQRAVATTNLAAFLIGFSMAVPFLIIPPLAQASGHGYGFAMSITASGLLMLPSALSQITGGPIAGYLGSRFGFQPVLAVGATMMTSSLVSLGLVHAEPWQVVIASLLLGVGISFAYTGLANLVMEAVPHHDVGIATGINTIMRLAGAAFGSVAAAAALTGAAIAGTSIPSDSGYRAAFLIAAACSTVAIASALAVPSRRRGG